MKKKQKTKKTHIKNKTIKCIIITAILLITTILSTQITHAIQTQQKTNTSEQYEKGVRYNIQGWVYIQIEGEPYERGYQYGTLAASEIIDMIQRWSNWGHNEKTMKIFILKNLPKNYDKLSQLWWQIVRKRAKNIFWEQYPEEYQQEIKGIADGVKAKGGTIHNRQIDYIDILAINTVEEIRQMLRNPLKKGRPILGRILELVHMLLGEKIQTGYDPGHCSAFIATGDATTNGEIILAHSLQFPPGYIPQRANIILDVKPSNGHRFIMTCFPGYIWSSEDYYQNEEGIILMETSLPQGPWKIKKTIPVGARARKAIQYSNCIDDVISRLIIGNNGLYPNDWIIGDTKTGEIASLELALYNHAITRTKNGFLYSCNFPKDDKVRWELYSFYGLGIPGRTILRWFKNDPTARDKKFLELKNKYYGEIDVEIAKKIMSVEPINKWSTNGISTNCKITSTKLVEQLGLWVHMGNPDGSHWNPSSELEKKLKGITEIVPVGWVKIFGSISQPTHLPVINTLKQDNNDKSKLLWMFKSENTKNTAYVSSALDDDIICSSTSDGNIYALNSDQGRLIGDIHLGEKFVGSAILKDTVFIGTNTGLYAIDKEMKEIEWKKSIGEVSSKPVISNNQVIASCSNGDIYAFNVDSGKTEWSYSFPDSSYISDVHKNILFVGTGKKCCALNTVNKELCWEYETDGVITTSPFVCDNNVYFGSWDGNIYSANSKTGEICWKYSTGWGIDTTPAVSNDLVFVGSNDNNFYALETKTGDLKWYFTCKSGIHSSPVVYGDYVFFGSDDGRLYALDKKNGELAWSFSAGYTINDGVVNNYISTPVLSDPIVDDGIVYIGVKGAVYALDAKTIETFTEESLEKSTGINTTLIIIILIAMFFIVMFLVTIYKRKKT